MRSIARLLEAASPHGLHCQTPPMSRSRDGVEIAFALYGADGRVDVPTVVLVHGWSGNRGFWAHQTEFLIERYRHIAVDLGGHGRVGARS